MRRMKGEKDKKRKKIDKEEVPKEETWINWWKNQWRGSNNVQAEVHLNRKKASGTKPAKDSDKADRRPDKTCLYMNDRAATTKDKEHLTGPHVLHNTKYGSQELLGMRTKVTTVKGTKEGRVKTV